jgi:TolA-binding protein
MLDEPVDVGPIVNADPVLRTTENSIPTVERNNQPRLKSDEVELNTLEQNVARRNEVETDIEIETLNFQLETIRNNQKDANFKFQKNEQDSELKTATEELDELNTKKKELDEVVADFINCRNGR